MYSELQRTDEPDRGTVRFTVLGPLEVLRQGVDYAPSAPKILSLLAVLVMRPGKMVHIDTLIRELWSDHPPRTVRTTLHTYVYHLRRCIDQNGLAADGEAMLATKHTGYTFNIDPSQVDTHRFVRLQQAGQERQEAGDHSGAADAYRDALDVWTGPPFANVQCGPVLSAYRTELLEQRRSVLHMRIEAEIVSGRHRELIGELRSLTTGSPLDEALHGQLMRALGRSGRRSDAMAVYRRLRSRLAGELGVEPCDDLQVLHRELISEGDHR
ncbi:MAG: family transcriptional regulator, regulator of embCAB operon [Actinomycetota bacterium]|jgi:DNA-binding SARP family transcriptional activator|nr:family transcriptional regulator, regulator of embCAB operon [Actinomycetota bacterium]